MQVEGQATSTCINDHHSREDLNSSRPSSYNRSLHNCQFVFAIRSFFIVISICDSISSHSCHCDSAIQQAKFGQSPSVHTIALPMRPLRVFLRRAFSTYAKPPPAAAHVPVLIVGAGPVGLTLSILLSQYGKLRSQP